MSLLMVNVSAIFAPAGTGKRPIDPPTATVLAVLAGLGEDAATDALRLEAAGLVVDELAAVIPAVHPAADRRAVPIARATAARRYLLIVVFRSVQARKCHAGWHSANLDPRLAGRIANLSQTCNIVRGPGTDRRRTPKAAGLPARRRGWHPGPFG